MRPLSQLRAMFARMRGSDKDHQARKDRIKGHLKTAAIGTGAALTGAAVAAAASQVANSYGHHVSKHYNDARNRVARESRAVGSRIVNIAQAGVRKANDAAQSVRRAGGRSLRTWSLGEGWSADQAVASSAGFIAQLAENSLRQRILRATDNITHQSARLVGLAQQHFTDEALNKLSSVRSGVTGKVGLSGMTSEEKALVSKIRSQISEQNRDLHLRKELRKLSDVNMKAAAQSLVEQMKLRNKEIHLASGIADQDIVDQTITRFFSAAGDTPERRRELIERAKFAVRGITIPA